VTEWCFDNIIILGYTKRLTYVDLQDIIVCGINFINERITIKHMARSGQRMIVKHPRTPHTQV